MPTFGSRFHFLANDWYFNSLNVSLFVTFFGEKYDTVESAGRSAKEQKKEDVLAMKHFAHNAIKVLFMCTVASAALAPAAHASIIYGFTEDGCTGNCGPQVGGFGTVTLTQVDSNTVSVTVDLFHGNEFVDTGNHDALTFNIDGATVTLSGFDSNFSQDLPPVADNPPYGPFSYGVSCTGCGPGGSGPVPSPLDFVVSRASGLLETDFVANTNGIFFAADILSGTTGKTGAVGSLGLEVGGHSATPEPATWGLIGLGLLAAGFVRKRTRQSN
jgi:hypothetical protein